MGGWSDLSPDLQPLWCVWFHDHCALWWLSSWNSMVSVICFITWELADFTLGPKPRIIHSTIFCRVFCFSFFISGTQHTGWPGDLILLLVAHQIGCKHRHSFYWRPAVYQPQPPLLEFPGFLPDYPHEGSNSRKKKWVPTSIFHSNSFALLFHISYLARKWGGSSFSLCQEGHLQCHSSGINSWGL